MVSHLRRERTRAFRIKTFSIIFFAIVLFRLYLDAVDYQISIPILDPVAFFIKKILITIFSFLAVFIGK